MNDLKFLLQTPCSIAISDNVDDLDTYQTITGSCSTCSL